MPDEKLLHVFVNRREFGEGDGVRHEMTGSQIAGLVDVPADNAVVRKEPENKLVPINEVVRIHNGERFLVTRKVVEGGNVTRAN